MSHYLVIHRMIAKKLIFDRKYRYVSDFFFSGEFLQHAVNRSHMESWKKRRGMERRGSL